MREIILIVERKIQEAISLFVSSLPFSKFKDSCISNEDFDRMVRIRKYRTWRGGFGKQRQIDDCSENGELWSSPLKIYRLGIFLEVRLDSIK